MTVNEFVSRAWIGVLTATCTISAMAQEAAVSPDRAAADAIAAFYDEGAATTTVVTADTYTVFRPDSRASRAAVGVVSEPAGFLTVLIGEMLVDTIKTVVESSELYSSSDSSTSLESIAASTQTYTSGDTMSTQEALAETTFVYSQGVVGQVTAGLDGVAVKVVAFDRPVDSFGLLEYDEGEARSIAEAAAGRGLGNGLLFEVQARIFHWEFDDGRQKHYVSAHSGRYATEWEMCKRIVPDIEQILAFRSETLEPTHHLMEDGQLKPIQMTQDSIGIVFDAAIPAAQRWNLVSSYEQVQSLDKVVYPEPMIQSSPFPNMWVLNFAAPLSQVRMEQIAAELKQSAAVRLACPVFRQRGYSEEIFEFIFVHALSVEALPGGEIDLDTQFNSDAAIDIVSRRQHASQFPVRYSARIDEGLSASDLIALSNRLYNDAGTKFVSLGKMLISSPLWNGVEN